MVLLIIGFVCFVLAMFGVRVGGVEMVAAGLAFVTAATLVGNYKR